MSKGLTIVIGILLTIFLLVCCGLSMFTGSYNSLVSQREGVETEWAQVETQYQRRFDLIPNLTSATQGYLTQEQKVFGDIAEARTRYAGAPSGSQEQIEAQSSLEGALSRLLVIVENYPELKSNETVRGLMDELAGTENRVNIARQRYNEVARDYNVSVKSFPRNIFAGMFGFDPKPLYEAEQGADKAPTVNLNGSTDEKK